jgi:phosphohistidine phosphatase
VAFRWREVWDFRVITLYLIRHTTAADIAPSDAQRPLTIPGEAEARKLGAALAKLNIQPNHIFSSPLLRARQTAGLVGEELHFPEGIETLAELENGASTTALLNALPMHPTGVMLLVGHMPSLTDHVAELIGGEVTRDLGFSKGSVACVTLAQLRVGTARLAWLKHLRDFA